MYPTLGTSALAQSPGVLWSCKVAGEQRKNTCPLHDLEIRVSHTPVPKILKKRWYNFLYF